ncbi:hypothetical protein HYQ46_008421 [Verticillium longisporum]|nr:hypothetical protein HYQ46_008421 [Verticillium longisporum]
MPSSPKLPSRQGFGVHRVFVDSGEAIVELTDASGRALPQQLRHESCHNSECEQFGDVTGYKRLIRTLQSSALRIWGCLPLHLHLQALPEVLVP